MQTLKRLTLLFSGCLLATACGDEGGSDQDFDDGDPNTIEVFEDISADTTWSSDKTYVLYSNVFVRDAVLTIEPGTVIKGEPNSSLIITNTAQIMAEGRADAPIVMTSNQPEGSQAAGDWGGLVLLGKAPINVTGGSDSIEGFAAGTEGTEYGGNDASHNCGTLQYARIEFAGFELSTDNELNGLTVGACGSETVLDYIQVHKGADDGVEFFGGTAGITHALITQPDDDGLDWDFGWTGQVQFLIVQQNSIVGNNAIEADSNKDDNDAEPRSAPTLWNVTFVGSDAEPGEAGKYQQGIHFRRGTAAMVHNLIMMHFADSPIDVDGESSVSQADEGKLVVANSLFFDNANSEDWPAEEGEDDNDGGFLEGDYFKGAELANRFMDPMLGDPTNLEAPDFLPLAESPALVDGATPGSGFDASATFVGAMGSQDWTMGWTAYP